MTGLPWSKFFWSDYASDPALKLCGFAAQGLWMRMLCIAAEHDPVGFVAVNGNPLDNRGIARMTGGSVDEVDELIAELERNGVFNRDRRGWIYSRRLINDAKKRRQCQVAGKKGGEASLGKDREKAAALGRKSKQGNERGNKPQKPEAREKDIDESISKKKLLPEAWAPELFPHDTKASSIERSWSEDHRRDQLEQFRDHHRKEGSKFVDWQAAWGTWIRNSERFRRERGGGSSSGGGSDYLDHVVSKVIPSLEGAK